MSAWYIIYAASFLLDAGFEAGFWPWGISGWWLLSTIVIAGWTLPPSRYAALSLSSTLLLDAARGDISFPAGTGALIIVIITIFLRGHVRTVRAHRLRELLVAWILAVAAFNLVVSAHSYTPKTITAAVLSFSIQVLAWNWLIFHTGLLPSRLKRAE